MGNNKNRIERIKISKHEICNVSIFLKLSKVRKIFVRFELLELFPNLNRSKNLRALAIF